MKKEMTERDVYIRRRTKLLYRCDGTYVLKGFLSMAGTSYNTLNETYPYRLQYVSELTFVYTYIGAPWLTGTGTTHRGFEASQCANLRRMLCN